MAFWLFRGRVGLKVGLLVFIIFDAITINLYRNRVDYQLISSEVSILTRITEKLKIHFENIYCKMAFSDRR